MDLLLPSNKNGLQERNPSSEEVEIPTARSRDRVGFPIENLPKMDGEEEGGLVVSSPEGRTDEKQQLVQ